MGGFRQKSGGGTLSESPSLPFSPSGHLCYSRRERASSRLLLRRLLCFTLGGNDLDGVWDSLLFPAGQGTSLGAWCRQNVSFFGPTVYLLFYLLIPPWDWQAKADYF